MKRFLLVAGLNVSPRNQITAGSHKYGNPIQEKLDGKVVDWMEPVSDEQYGQAPEKL